MIGGLTQAEGSCSRQPYKDWVLVALRTNGGSYGATDLGLQRKNSLSRLDLSSSGQWSNWSCSMASESKQKPPHTRNERIPRRLMSSPSHFPVLPAPSAGTRRGPVSVRSATYRRDRELLPMHRSESIYHRLKGRPEAVFSIPSPSTGTLSCPRQLSLPR